MIVFRMRLICDTETPTMAGPIRRRMRRKPTSFQSSEKRGSMPIFFRCGNWKASCSAPPINTAQASTSTCGSKYGAAKSAMAIIATLSSTGVKAGTAKRPQVLSTPPASATSDMNRM